MSRIPRLAATVAATAVVLAPALAAGSAHADASSFPKTDPFYRYTATGTPYVPAASSKPGEVLDTRPVHLGTMVDLVNALAASSAQPYDTFAIDASQLLYRTTDEQGHASATVTTVLKPTDLATPIASKGVVAYLSYYDGLSDTCDPSYTLQNSKIDGEKAVIGQLLESGYTVTVPDFEGEGLDWAAGHEAGKSTLDAIRATEKSLGLPASTKVATIGYSGGSIAGEWAAELQPTYAPDVNLIGTAVGGVPANLRHLVSYVDSVADADRDSWFGVIPAATVSLGRAVGKDFSSYLNDAGKKIAAAVGDQCIGAFANKYPGMHLADLMADPSKSFLDLPEVKPIADGLQMGRGATPTAPMLMMNGRSSDGIGDGVMVADDVKALAANYCERGVAVQYVEQAGLHGAVGQSFMLKGLNYIGKWFRGSATAADYNCAPRVIGDPLPAPHAPHATIKARSQGRKDVIVIGGSGSEGDEVRVFVAGHKKPVGQAIVRKGRASVAVVDRNGRRKTTYKVVVGHLTARVTVR